MKHFMTTTALTLLVSTSAFAQTTLSTDADVATDTELSAQADVNAETDLLDDAGNALAEAGDNIEAGAEATGDAIAEAGSDMKDGAHDMFADMNDAITSPRIENGELVAADLTLMTTAEIEGAVVYDMNDEEIGEISTILMSETGEAEAAIIDVGGFLGLGEKPVAVPFSDLALFQANADADVVVYVDYTEEALKAMPEYEES